MLRGPRRYRGLPRKEKTVNEDEVASAAHNHEVWRIRAEQRIHVLGILSRSCEVNGLAFGEAKVISCFLDEVSRSLLGPIQEELAIMVFAFAAAGSGDDCELACD